MVVSWARSTSSPGSFRLLMLAAVPPVRPGVPTAAGAARIRPGRGMARSVRRDEEVAVAVEVRGVVSRGRGEPVTVQTVLVPDPGPGEAVVDVQACGVCHTDLHYREGGISDDYPFLLGHEAAGLVSAVGEGVTGLEAGDFVILNWRAVCGVCRACARGRPWYCFDTANATRRMTVPDGTELSPALGIGALAEKTLVAAGQCTKVDPAAPAAVAGLLGCGVMAGIGAAINTGGVTRGDTVAVYGCGGVGAAAVAGAALAGARTIVAVDVDARKLGAARRLGATQAVNATVEDPVEAIRKATGGYGADVVIEAVGHPETYRQAFYSRDLAGTLVLVGVPTPDFPLLIDLYLQGRLDLDRFVSATITIDEVEDAFAAMRRGDVLRSV